MIRYLPLLLTLLWVCPGFVVAQEASQEPLAIVELGAAPSRNLKDHASSLGPTVAVEVSPIERWLELEAGVTPSFGRHSTEWATDLLFKKPWTLSPKVEFMAGIGPEWIHTRESGVSRNSVAGEAALDSCFGRGRNASSDGMSNRLMSIILGAGTSVP